jgi:hypothetical protein
LDIDRFRWGAICSGVGVSVGIWVWVWVLPFGLGIGLSSGSRVCVGWFYSACFSFFANVWCGFVWYGLVSNLCGFGCFFIYLVWVGADPWFQPFGLGLRLSPGSRNCVRGVSFLLFFIFVIVSSRFVSYGLVSNMCAFG